MREVGHSQPRPLVVTSDPALLDDVLRLAAAVDVEPEVAPDLGAARRLWQASPMIVVCAKAAATADPASLPRRPEVYVTVSGPVDAAILRVGLALGAAAVLSLPDDDARLAAAFADTVESGGRSGPVVAVVGARGGAGASTLAAALAVTAARRDQQVVLVDADPFGGGIELVLGGEDESGLRWSALRSTRGRTSGSTLRAALPTCRGVGFVSWDRAAGRDVPTESVASVVEAAARVSDIVVGDVARYPDRAGDAVLTRSTTAFLVVPAEVRAAAAGERAVNRLSGYVTDVRAVVRVPGPCSLEPRAVAEALGIPLFAELRSERGIGQSLEQGSAPAGSGRGPLARLSHLILDDIGARPALMAGDPLLAPEAGTAARPPGDRPAQADGDLWPDEDEVMSRIVAYTKGPPP